MLASAADLPTPGTLQRLVAATEVANEPRGVRALPFGAAAASIADETVAAPPPCVAFAAGTDTDHESPPDDVRRCDEAAVFTDRRYDDAPATAPLPTDPPAPTATPPLCRRLPSTSSWCAAAWLPGLPCGAGAAALPDRRDPDAGHAVLLLEEVLTCLAAQTSGTSR